MYIEREELEEYPFTGYFYDCSLNEDVALDEQSYTKNEILKTPCDIMESSHTEGAKYISSDYVVYFPFSKETETIGIKSGHFFEAEMYGMEVSGKVVGVFPSQLGGCKVYISNIDF